MTSLFHKRCLPRAIFLSWTLIGLAAQASLDDATAYSVRESGEFVTLSDGRSVELTVSPKHGGELSGLRVFFQGGWHELIYRANDYSKLPGFQGKASLLWPATGVSITAGGEKNQYEMGGERYEMPFHGFARQQEWQVIESDEGPDEAIVILGLTDTLATRQLYPFEFDVRVAYRISSDQVSLSYSIHASKNNVRSMPFSIGNHISFKIPLIGGSSIDAVRFSSNLPDQMVMERNRTFSGQIVPTPFPGVHRLDELPRRRSVSIGGIDGRSTLTLSDESGFQLQLAHEVQEGPSPDAVRFNLWVDLEDGFFCPQPWAGAQNSLNSGLGLIQLQPGARWQWRIDISTPLVNDIK